MLNRKLARTQFIAEHMVKNEIGQVDLANHFGLTEGGISKWFKTGIPSGRLEDVCTFLKLDYDAVLKIGIDESDQHQTAGIDGHQKIKAYNIQLAAGNGRVIPEFIETAQYHLYKSSFLNRMGLKNKDLFIGYASGDSMIPVICDGDKLLIDRSRINVRDDKIYAIFIGGELRVKRLRKLLDGSIEIKSDNPNFENLIVSPSDESDLQIIGQVIEVTTIVL